MKYLISGGGTGGHIFPAISIARKIQQLDKHATILFIGAEDRMEMTKIPQAGFDIVGLPIKGIDRKHLFKNIIVFYHFLISLFRVRRVIAEFRPDVGVGVGGYASAAAMKMAAWMKIPILIQEQNSFAGITNKILRNNARHICVAYEGMERFFPKDKIILTGNPIRSDLLKGDKQQAQKMYFPDNLPNKTLLILGGSLGAKSINEAVMSQLESLLEARIQVIWQTGKNYYQQCRTELEKYVRHEAIKNIYCSDFINTMPDAYALADLVVSRAGAGTIAELCTLAKPSILVPSPNVTEDHQTHNALALVKKNAAVLIQDANLDKQLVPTALTLLQNQDQLSSLSQNAAKLARPDADVKIAQLVVELAKEKYV